MASIEGSPQSLLKMVKTSHRATQKKKTYCFPLNPGCLIGNDFCCNPHITVIVFHPIYKKNNQGPFCSLLTKGNPKNHKSLRGIVGQGFLIKEKYHPFMYTRTSWWLNQPIWKNISQIGLFPQVVGENKTYLSCHHPENQILWTHQIFRENAPHFWAFLPQNVFDHPSHHHHCLSARIS